MAVITPTTTIGVTNVVNAEAGDTVNLRASVVIGASNGTAILGTGAGITVNVAGEVYGNVGIDLRGDIAQPSDATVNVQEGGSVYGVNALTLQGGGIDVVNDGAIDGAITAISIETAAAGSGSIVNRGSMSAQAAVIQIESVGQAFSIRNEGLMLALKEGNYALFVNGSANGAIAFVNRGTVQGTIQLGSGNDVYDGGTGRVDGAILGRGGNDRFVLGTGSETIDGGDGSDTVSIAGRPGARIALDGSFAGTGRAAGDTLLGIENVVGSARGADVLRGDLGANLLDGRGGRDRLAGGAGDDTLVGGAGGDRLAGGAGDDVFQFGRATEGGDRIADFRGAPGNDDRFRFDDAGFGDLEVGALAAGQFRTRANASLALDADDRFVFRTSDATLWFDADGRGGDRSVLIADLQAGASVTAADILIF